MELTLLKQMTRTVAVTLLLLSTVTLFGQTTSMPTEERGNDDGKGYGIRAKDGKGKYRAAIYWLSFGRLAREPIHELDSATFTTPGKTKYKVVISDIKGYDRLSTTQKPQGGAGDASTMTYDMANPKKGYLLAGNPSDAVSGYPGNNFPYAYDFKNNVDDATETEIDANGNPTKITNHHNIKGSR